MNDVHTQRPQMNSGRVKNPWLIFCWLTFLLFLGTHPKLFIDRSSQEYMTDSYVEASYGGSIPRRVAFPLFALTGVIALSRGGARNLRWKRQIGAVGIALGLWVILSVLWSIDPPTTVRRLIVLVFYFIGAFGFASRYPPRLIVNFVAFAGSLLLSYGVAGELLFGRFRLLDPSYRFSGDLHPNVQGQGCVFLVLSAIAAARLNPSSSRTYRLMALYGFVFMILTRSRTSMAGCLAGLAVYWLLVLPTSKKWRLVFLVTITFLISFLLAGELFSGFVPNVVLLGRGGTESVATFEGRTVLWAECIEYARIHPVIGYGYEAFWGEHHIDLISSSLGWAIHSAHSAYLELLLNLGMVGLVLHTLFLLLILRESLRFFRATKDPSYALCAGVVAVFLVFGILETTVLIRVATITFYALALFLSVGFVRFRQPNPAPATAAQRVRRQSASNRLAGTARRSSFSVGAHSRR